MPFTFFWNRKNKALKKEIFDLNQEILSLEEHFNNDRNILEEKCRKSHEELQATQLQMEKVSESLEEEQKSKALLKQDLDLKNTTIEDLKEQLEPNLQNSLLAKYKNKNKQLLLSNDSLSQELCVKDQLTLKKNAELSDAHEKMKSLEERLASERHHHEKQMEELQKKMEHQGQILKEREDQLQEKQTTVARLTKELEEQDFLVQTFQENHGKIQGLTKEIAEVMNEREEERAVLMTQLSELKQIVKEKTTANDELMKEKEEALRINKELSAKIEEKETCVQSALQAAEELKSSLQEERDKKQNLREVSRTENQTRAKHVQELIEKYEHDCKSSLQDERDKNLLEVSRTENQTRAKDFLELKDRFDLNHRLLLQEQSENEALRKKIQDLEEGMERLREDFNSSPKVPENLSSHVKWFIEQFEKAKTQTADHSQELDPENEEGPKELQETERHLELETKESSACGGEQRGT